jgi:uncharacterized protein YjbI with pentapeptide repeats
MYHFKGVRLSRADVEWLLAMEEQRGVELSPRDGKGGNRHKSFELNLRGVDLSQVNLSNAQLQGAQLSWVTLDEAVRVEAYLEGADLGKASLKQAILAGHTPGRS